MLIFPVIALWLARAVQGLSVPILEPRAMNPVKDSFAAIPASQNLAKRQVYMRARRAAVITYRCPVLGIQQRDFRWEAVYDRGTIQLFGRHNIDSWDHVQTVANDFGTYFHSKSCHMVESLCCIHEFKGKVIGSVYEDHLDLSLVTARINPANQLKVVELCIRVRDRIMCLMDVCPVISSSLATCLVLRSWTGPY